MRRTGRPRHSATTWPGAWSTPAIPDAEIWLDRDAARPGHRRDLQRPHGHLGIRRGRAPAPPGHARSAPSPGGTTTRPGSRSLLTAGGHQIRFGYDAAGRETRRDLPGGLILAQDWDRRGRLTVQALTAGARARRAVPAGPGGPPPWARRASAVGPAPGSAAGLGSRRAVAAAPRLRLQRRRLRHRHRRPAGRRRAVGLDPAGRVTAVNGPDWAERYAYDPAGNMSAAAWPAPPPGPAGPPGPARTRRASARSPGR